jgi:methyltransferase-like protein 6
MDHDEKALVISYYLLYNNIAITDPTAAVTVVGSNNNNHTTKTNDVIEISNNIIDSVTTNNLERYGTNIVDNNSNNIEISTIPWVDDEWTLQDEQEAATLLEEAMDRCRIVVVNDGSIQRTTKAITKNQNDDIQAWNRFYQNHQSNFFKDRHYFTKEFPNEFLIQPESITITKPTTTTTLLNNNNGISDDITVNDSNNQVTHVHRCLVEIGCGVGNAMLPLLEIDDRTNNSDIDNESTQPKIQWTVYGFDLSNTAIDIVRNDIRYQKAAKQNRAYCDVCDISAVNIIPSHVYNVAHVTSLLFCLSAIHPSKHSIVFTNIIQTLQPGHGIFIFRDYGRYDLAQMKLGIQRSKLIPNTNNFYRKHDGTKCYYFTIQDIEQLVQIHNDQLEILELKYIRRKYINRFIQSIRRRVWVQGRFRRKSLLEQQHTQS